MISVIMKRELKSYFTSPVAYIVTCAFLIVSGFMLFSFFFLANRAELREFFVNLPWLYAIFIPALTMRLFSEERGRGTLETLMTLPVSSCDVVLGKFLASFIGCNIFDVAQPKKEHLFYANGRGCKAKGFYSSNGFTILKGSLIAKDIAPSFPWRDKREKLLQEYTELKGSDLVVISNKTFSSPSTAATFVLGRSSNGWLDWKDEEGNTLDSVYRKQLD